MRSHSPLPLPPFLLLSFLLPRSPSFFLFSLSFFLLFLYLPPLLSRDGKMFRREKISLSSFLFSSLTLSLSLFLSLSLSFFLLSRPLLSPYFPLSSRRKWLPSRGEALFAHSLSLSSPLSSRLSPLLPFLSLCRFAGLTRTFDRTDFDGSGLTGILKERGHQINGQKCSTLKSRYLTILMELRSEISWALLSFQAPRICWG